MTQGDNASTVHAHELSNSSSKDDTCIYILADIRRGVPQKSPYHWQSNGSNSCIKLKNDLCNYVLYTMWQV